MDLEVLEPHKAKSLPGLSISLTIISALVLILRFWSRYTLPTKRFRLDDWFALAAWPCLLCNTVFVVIRLRYGNGRHLRDIPYANLRLILLTEWIGYHFWQVSMALIRASALCFYWRIFDLQKRYIKFNFWGATAGNILWVSISGLVIAFQCTPVDAAWNQYDQNICLDLFKMFLGIGATSVFLDIWILLIPMPLIWALNLPRRRRVVLSVVFALGYCVVVLALGRLIAAAVIGKAINEDFTWTFVDLEYWYAFEIELGFICISLPAIFHLGNRVRRYGIESAFNSAEYSDRRELGASEATLVYTQEISEPPPPVNTIRKQVSVDVEFGVNDHPHSSHHQLRWGPLP